MTQLWYVAHPVAPPCACGLSHVEFQAVACNCHMTRLWLKWLWRACPSVTLVCPWLPIVEVVGDDGEGNRERGLRDCEAIARSCHGIILVGGRVSSGMARERAACTFEPSEYGGFECDLTNLGPYPPKEIPTGLPWPIQAKP